MAHIILGHVQVFVVLLANAYPIAMSANISISDKESANTSAVEMADNSEEESEKLSLAGKVVYGIVIPIMSIVCIVGNILTMVSYAQDRKLRTVHNTYLISLAASDLLIGCVSMPFYGTFTVRGYHWPFGKAFCKVVMSMDFTACMESVLVVILVSYDRCMLLVQGATYSSKQTIRVAKIRIFISWAICFIVNVPAILFWDVLRGYSSIEDGDCDVEFYTEFGFTVGMYFIQFLVPLIIISALNIYLYSLILKRSREMPGKNESRRNRQNNGKDKPPASEGTDEPQNNNQVNAKRDRKAARSLAILVSVFTVCWMPFTICTVIIAFCEECVSQNLHEASAWILWGNSSLNSFLYALTNKRFRMNYIRLLRLHKLCLGTSKVAPEGSMTT